MSLYKANIALNSGAIVDVDTTDTTAISASGGVGFGTLYAGSLALYTSPAYTAATDPSGFVWPFPRELGICIPTVNTTGPLLIERLLDLASSYMTIAEGMNAAIYLPAPGDIIATTEYVGYLAGDGAATGKIDNTLTTNLGKPCEVYQGRFRLSQNGNVTRARYLGNTTANSAVVGIFQIA